MQKVLIIEDDHFSARRLKRLIMDIDDTIDVHGPLKSVAEVTEELAANNDYDLIFSTSDLPTVTCLKRSAR